MQIIHACARGKEICLSVAVINPRRMRRRFMVVVLCVCVCLLISCFKNFMSPRLTGTSHSCSCQLLGKWSSLVADLQRGQLISIPRCYFDGIDGEIVSYHLCGFCDASVNAYATVVYLVIRTESGS